MKKFTFSLTEELHSKLKTAAQQQETSMSAICREALASHLHRSDSRFEQSLEQVLASLPDLRHIKTSWGTLKAQVWNFLNTPINGPDFFDPNSVPGIPGFDNDELFGHLPKAKTRPSTVKRTRSDFDHVRFLDELWA